LHGHATTHCVGDLGLDYGKSLAGRLLGKHDSESLSQPEPSLRSKNFHLDYFDSTSDSWHRLLAVVPVLPLDALAPAYSFFTSVALVVTHLGRYLQQTMDRILKALHPNMCINPATIIVEGYTQCWG
jgi:hypothetical protein